MRTIRIAVLMTCFNRKSVTIGCLNSFFTAASLVQEIAFDIYLVDDNSVDNTSGEVKDLFDGVNVISGSGDLYWNRGMNLAWRHAVDSGIFYDYFLWLNDDVSLRLDVFVNLLQYLPNDGIFVGSTFDSKLKNMVSYGGYDINDKKIIPDGKLQTCNYFNGNFVLISHVVFESLGYLDDIFHHAIGDFDYGLRARSKFIQCMVLPFFVGDCSSHSVVPKWRDPDLNIFVRLSNLYNPLSGCVPHEYFLFDLRHKGFLWALIHYISIHLRTIFPWFWHFK